ncbi:DUF302 domain-containing protein [Nocardia sp. NPDC049149]|uniref:DUF302 domain-containing protein n=1 Tax=Nocardia sp. NPDC049149 TaxID=3364315 RepID=UPI003721B506
MSYRVAVVESTTQTMLELRRTVRTDRAGDDVNAGMRALYGLAERTGLAPVGPPSTTYLGEFGPGMSTTVDFGLPVAGGPLDDGTDQVRVRHLEPAWFAHTTHRGDYTRIGDAYRALEEWIRASKFRPVGPLTEVYLIAPEEAVHPRDLVTEVRIPVVAATELSIRVPALFANTVSELRKVLAKHGFRVMTEIDMRQSLQTSLGVRMGEYLILGACHPALSHRALTIDPRMGLLLPCNVVVRRDGDTTLVEAVDPELLLASFLLPNTHRPELHSIAREARADLTAALEIVEKRLCDTE